MQPLLTITKTLPKSPLPLVWVTKTNFLISLPVCTLPTHPHTCCLFSTTDSREIFLTYSKNVTLFVSNIPMAPHLIYNKRNSLYNSLWIPTWSGWLARSWLPSYYLLPSWLPSYYSLHNSFLSSHNGLLAMSQQSRHISAIGTLPNSA